MIDMTGLRLCVSARQLLRHLGEFAPGFGRKFPVGMQGAQANIAMHEKRECGFGAVQRQTREGAKAGVEHVFVNALEQRRCHGAETFGRDFRTRDGRYVMICIFSDRHLEALAKAGGFADAFARIEKDAPLLQQHFAR